MNTLRWTLLALIIAAVSPAQAAYFRVLRPLDEIKTGAFVKVGTPNENVSYGFQTTILKHQSADGFLLIPGVSWSLLDVGAAKSEAGAVTAVLGPSVDLSEPVKAVLLAGLRHAVPNGLGSIKAMLAPAQDGKACLALSLGPGFAVEHAERVFYDPQHIAGALVAHAGLSAKW